MSGTDRHSGLDYYARPVKERAILGILMHETKVSGLSAHVVLKETIGCVANGCLEDLFCNPPWTAVFTHQVHC